MREYYNDRIILSDEVMNFPKSFYGYVVYITSVDDLGFFLNIRLTSQEDIDSTDEFISIPVENSRISLGEIDKLVQKEIANQYYTVDIGSISDFQGICSIED